MLKVVFLIFAVSTTVLSQGTPLEYRILDVSGCVMPVRDSDLGAWGLPIADCYADVQAPDEDSGSRSPIQPETLVSIIRDTVAVDSWEEEGVQIQISPNGRQLFVRQSRPVLDAVEGLLASFSEYIRRPIKLTVLLVEGSHGDLAGLGVDGGVVPSSRCEDIMSGRIQGISMVGIASAFTLNGQRTRIRKGRRQSFCASYDSQIAQDTSLAVPEVRELIEGFDISVRPVVLVDGRVNLRVQCDLATDLQLRPFASGSPSLGELQLPHCVVQKVAASGLVASGQALAAGSVGGDAGGPRQFLLVRAETIRKGSILVGEQDQPVGLYSLDYLAAPCLQLPQISLEWNGRAGWVPVSRVDFRSDNDDPGVDVEELEDLITSVVTPGFWDESEQAVLMNTSAGLLLKVPTAQHEGVRGLLKHVTNAKARFVCLESFVVSVPRTHLLTIRSSGGGDWIRQILSSSQTRRIYSSIGASELGGVADWVAGTESAYLADYDAEVAQGSKLSRPRIATTFNGLYLRLAPFALGTAGRVGVRYQYWLSTGRGDPEIYDGKSPDHGRIQLPGSRMVEGTGDVVLGGESYGVIAEFSSPNDPEETQLIIIRARGTAGRSK